MISLWNNWLILSFVAPFLWALVNIIDLFLVNEAYEDEYDGAIVTGFFHFIPWLILPWFGFSLPDGKVIFLALLGGILFCISMFYYFKALFTTKDASFILILWNLTALVVPILAFIILNERLSFIQYLGIFITFLGVLLLTLYKKYQSENTGRVVKVMSGAILFFSVSMVVQDKVYSLTTFWNGFLLFSLGNILCAVIIFIIRKKKTVRHLFRLNQKYFTLFLITELITLMGVTSAQRAIDVSPSVSFVAAIESTQPAFIMIGSAILFAIFKFFGITRKELMEKLYKEQRIGLGTKILATIIMAVGIYLINK